MRIRTGHSPDAWSPNVPQAAHITSHAFAVSAVTIPDMRRVLTQGTYLENRSRRKASRAFSLHPENRT